MAYDATPRDHIAAAEASFERRWLDELCEENRAKCEADPELRGLYLAEIAERVAAHVPVGVCWSAMTSGYRFIPSAILRKHQVLLEKARGQEAA